LSAAEWAYWQARDRLSPIGDERLDVLAGTVAANAVNVWGSKDSQPVRPLDTIPDWGGRREYLERQQRRRTRKSRDRRARELWQARAEADQARGLIPDSLEIL
jgi:hypothetical protein